MTTKDYQFFGSIEVKFIVSAETEDEAFEKAEEFLENTTGKITHCENVWPGSIELDDVLDTFN